MITEMVLENFKSYAGAQRVGPFHKARRRRPAAPAAAAWGLGDRESLQQGSLIALVAVLQGLPGCHHRSLTCPHPR